VVEVLDRFPGVVSLHIAFLVDKEFVPIVLAALIKYLLGYPFFCIVDKDECWFVYPEGLESIRVIFSVFIKGGNVEVGFLACHSEWEM